MKDNNSQQKCKIIIDNKEYLGTLLKLNQNEKLFYILISEQIKRRYKKNINIIYNNKK
jgi:hypothetical protein